MLFTHRGLSGPAILQISSYWHPGESVEIDMLPDIDLIEALQGMRAQFPRKNLKTVLTELLPRRVVEAFVDTASLDKKMANCDRNEFERVADQLKCWRLKPNATEGYRTAEVTVGGVDCLSYW